MPRAKPPKGHILYALGNLIQARRVAAGLTQVELAELCSVHLRSIKNWESGRNEPGIEHLKRIAYFCDMELSTFLRSLDSHKVPIERTKDARSTWRHRFDESTRVRKKPEP